MSERTRKSIGVLAALPEELGGLPTLARATHSAQTASVHELELEGFTLHCIVSGVGKVHAARAATLLIERGIERLLVVGTCGGLRRSLAVGTMVHCTTAFQADLALRDGRRVEADAAWREAWKTVLPGPEGWFLTADRPVLTPWRRLRLARAFAGPCVADMETAAAARVAEVAGLPFAALRAVTDGAGLTTRNSFKENFPTLAPRAADSIAALLARARSLGL